MDTIRKIVRFVSLIPFLDDWMAFPGDNDIWCTSNEFLEISAGDWEEHAVLLCNLFRYHDERERKGTGYKSYLVLGRGMPEGDTVYCLRTDADFTPRLMVLWNASTGEGYNVNDPRCPLIDIAAVVDSTNVFGGLRWRSCPC